MITLSVVQSLVPKRDQFTPSRLRKLSQAFESKLPQAVGAVEVSFVTDQEIRRLNRMYRGKDAVTDVLSFPSENGEITGQLGDVLIAYEQAARQAADGDITLELDDLLVHGILHLLGYDHELPADAARMFPLQDAIVSGML